MQICHFLLLLELMLFGLFSKENLNLLKSSQNSFLGLQPEPGHRHSARFQLGEVGGGKSEPLSLLPLSSFYPAWGQSGLMAGARAGHLGFASPVQSPWCAQETDWAPSPGGGVFSSTVSFSLQMAAVTTHTQPLSLFSLSSGGPLLQGQLRGLVLPVAVLSPLSCNLRKHC